MDKAGCNLGVTGHCVAVAIFFPWRKAADDPCQRRSKYLGEVFLSGMGEVAEVKLDMWNFAKSIKWLKAHR